MAKKLKVAAEPGISPEALAKAREEDAEIHRPLREANERGRQWCEVARHAQGCREYAQGGYMTRGDPPGVLVEQSGYARDPVVDPEVNLYVSRRWVTEFWGELIKHLPPVMDRAAVAALAAPEGFRPQAKLAFEAVRAQFLRRLDGAKIDAVVNVVCKMRAALGAERSLVGCFFEPLEQLARLRQAQASEEGSRIKRELRARSRGKPAVNASEPLSPPVSQITDDLEPTHSEDFTTVNWFGTRHRFTKRQSEVVALLWAEWERRKGSLAETLIGEKVRKNWGGDFRLRDVFRIKGKTHAAWGTMIVPTTRGVFALSSDSRQKPR